MTALHQGTLPGSDRSSPLAFVASARHESSLRVRDGGQPVAFRPDGRLPDADDDLVSASGGIRCPSCGWQPERRSRWFCVPMGPPENFAGGCGHRWNTFDTGGVCPGCTHRWQHTTCLNCSVTSRHSDWYAPPGSGPQP